MARNKLKVIFRKCKDGGSIIAFLPELPANYGNIESYMHVGQHSEASIEFYRDGTIPAYEEDYKNLLEELESIYYDEDLCVYHRLQYNDLRSKAWRR